MRRLAAIVVAACLVVGCSSSNDGSEDPLLARTVGEAGAELPIYDASSTEPPLVTLVREDNTLSVAPFSFCWTAAESEAGICADGTPPDEPPILAGDGPVAVYFPVDDFQFEARVFDVNYENSQSGPEIVRASDRWEFTPNAGQAGIVELFGFGEKNDVIVSFQVTG